MEHTQHVKAAASPSDEEERTETGRYQVRVRTTFVRLDRTRSAPAAESALGAE